MNSFGITYACWLFTFLHGGMTDGILNVYALIYWGVATC